MLGGRNSSGLVSRVSIRIAMLTPLLGAVRPGLPPAGKSYIRRQSAIQLLSSRFSPFRSPPSAEKMNIQSRLPKSPGNLAFQLYSLRIMLCPSRNAATENSSGIVGMSVGAASGSTSLRPLLNTSLTTEGWQIRGR